MIQAHTVKPGESLDVIAKKYGLPGWETVYQYPLNKNLRQQRPNPNKISSGDVVIIPDKAWQSTSSSFGEFMVKVLALEEAALAQKLSFRDRVTALRLIYYPNRPIKEYGGTILGGGPWPLIIPGAANVQMPASWSQAPLKDLVAQLKKSQVLDIGNEKVDIGHLLAGLDARLRPSTVSVTMAKLPAIQMRSNQEAATYVGDLGSVVANYAPTVTLMLWQKVEASAAFNKTYSSWASDVDHLGNIDSYSMALDETKTVTQNLLGYYLAQTGGVRKRFSTFIAAVSLRAPATQEALKNEMFSAAQLVLAGDKKIGALMELYQQPSPSTVALRPRAVIYSEVVNLTMKTFTDWCEKWVKSEALKSS